jgi:hypothetical protein
MQHCCFIRNVRLGHFEALFVRFPNSAFKSNNWRQWHDWHNWHNHEGEIRLTSGTDACLDGRSYPAVITPDKPREAFRLTAAPGPAARVLAPGHRRAFDASAIR